VRKRNAWRRLQYTQKHVKARFLWLSQPLGRLLQTVRVALQKIVNMHRSQWIDVIVEPDLRADTTCCFEKLIICNYFRMEYRFVMYSSNNSNTTTNNNNVFVNISQFVCRFWQNSKCRCCRNDGESPSDSDADSYAIIIKLLASILNIRSVFTRCGEALLTYLHRTFLPQGYLHVVWCCLVHTRRVHELAPSKPSGYSMYHLLLKLYIVPTQCICVFRMVLTTNSDCFPKQN
jgi:hypothetical protein